MVIKGISHHVNCCCKFPKFNFSAKVGHNNRPCLIGMDYFVAWQLFHLNCDEYRPTHFSGHRLSSCCIIVAFGDKRISFWLTRDCRKLSSSKLSLPSSSYMSFAQFVLLRFLQCYFINLFCPIFIAFPWHLRAIHHLYHFIRQQPYFTSRSFGPLSKAFCAFQRQDTCLLRSCCLHAVSFFFNHKTFWTCRDKTMWRAEMTKKFLCCFLTLNRLPLHNK